MNREQLLKELDALFAEMERGRAWGTVEVEYREGVPNMIRTARNKKLNTAQETNRAKEYRQ